MPTKKKPATGKKASSVTRKNGGTPMSDSLSDYVTTKEAAELLGIRPDSVQHLLTSGRLKGFQVGREWLVFKPSIEEYYRTKAASGKPTSRTPKIAATAK
jgi:excisionase family DNA binding protein